MCSKTRVRRMNRGVREAWLRALASGTYIKGHGKLRDRHDRFDPFGVLCDLHAKATGQRWGKNDEGEWVYLDQRDYLPDEVTRWAGLTTNDPLVPQLNKTISELSDFTGTTYDNIIRVIREYL